MKEYNTKQCTGCGLCELACSFHRYGVFNPKKSAIQISSREYEIGKITIVHFEDECRNCDCEEGKYFCLNYCPIIARDELKTIVMNKSL